jgi:hypothetical protein
MCIPNHFLSVFQSGLEESLVLGQAQHGPLDFVQSNVMRSGIFD